MSKMKSKLGRQIMAVALSLAMIMSNMTVYASELTEPQSETVYDDVGTEETGTESLTEEKDEKESDDEGEVASQEDTEESDENNEDTSSEMSSETESDGSDKKDDSQTDSIVDNDEETMEEEAEESDSRELNEDNLDADIKAIKAGEGVMLDVTKLKATTVGTTDTVATAGASEISEDGHFKVLYHKEANKSKLDTSGTKKWYDKDGNEIMDDENVPAELTSGKTARINFQGSMSKSDSVITSAIQLKVEAKARIKVYFATGGAGRQIGLKNSDWTTVAETNVSHDADKFYICEFNDVDPGTYYIGTTSSNNYIFGVYVEAEATTAGITVSGTVTSDDTEATYDNLKIVFTNKADTDSNPIKVPVSEGEDGEYTYSAKLPIPESGTDTYNVSLENANGFALEEDVTVAVDSNDTAETTKTVDIVLVKQSSYELSGTVSGLDEVVQDDTDGKIKINFIPLTETGEVNNNVTTPDALTVKDMNDKKYTVELQAGITYEIKTEGANDYQLKTSDIIEEKDYTNKTVLTVTLSEAVSDVELAYELKPTHDVTITSNDTTITAEQLKDVVITFTHKEDGDKYKFTIGSEGTIATDALGKFPLRDGTYTVEVTSDDYYTEASENDLVVEGADVTYEIKLSAVVVIEPVDGTKYMLDANELGVGTKEKDTTSGKVGDSGKFEVVYYKLGTTQVKDVTGVNSWLNEKGEVVKDVEAPDLNSLVGLVSGGKSTTDNGRYIQFTTDSYAVIKLFWSPNSATPDGARQIGVTNSNNFSYDTAKNLTSTEITGDNKHGYVSELTINDAGTYNLVFQANSIIYKVVITEIDKGERTEWAEVADPEIKSVVPNPDDAAKLDVTVDAVVGYDGGDSLTVTMKDKDGKTVGTAETKTDALTPTISLIPDDSAESGEYTFVAELMRTSEESKKVSQEFTYTYTKPLSAPRVEVTNLGGGAVKVSWEKVSEAEEYIVTVKDSSDAPVAGIEETVTADKALNVTIEAGKLEIGKEYTFVVTAVRGEETTEGSAKATVSEDEDVEDEHVLITSEYEGSGVIPVGTTYDNGYFVVTGTVNQKSEEYFELTKSKGGAIRFRVTGTAKVIVGAGSTGSSNTSPIAIVNENGKNMPDVNGKEQVDVTGTSTTTIIYELPAGIYKVLTPGGSRAARLYSLEVLEKGAVEIVRGSWESAAAPVITSVSQDAEKDTGVLKDTMTIEITVPISDDGADAVRAEIRDDEGKVIASGVSVEWTNTHTITITPGASGNYTIAAVAYRNDNKEATKEGKYADKYLFKLPLTKPEIASVTSLGRDAEDPNVHSVEIEWREVLEADEYIIKAVKVPVADKEEAESVSELPQAENAEAITQIVRTADLKDGEFKYIVSSDKFEVGQNYSFTLQARRDAESIGQALESAVSEAKTVMVTDDEKTKWGTIIYGSSTSTDEKKDGFRNIVYNENGDLESVDVYSISNSGKIVPNSTDGIAFWYTEINPETDNFTLIATAEVNNWTYSNGQEGFGLLAADRIPEASTSEMFWNNSYMALISKVEYYWDGEQVSDAGDKISMYLGVGSLEKQGVTPAGLEELANGATIPTTFTTLTETLETSCARSGSGTYNIVDRYTNDSVAGTVNRPYFEFNLKITKNNTGYFVSYWNPEIGDWTTNKYYDTEALSQLNSDTVYVGFFASRNADIKFKDIKFIRDDEANHGPAEDKPTKYVTPSYQILSGSTSNSAEHELIFNSNWNGEVAITDSLGNSVLKDADGNTVQTLKVKGNLDTSPDEAGEGATEEEIAAINTNPRKAIVKVPLVIGVNEFKVTFTPDSKWTPDRWTQLSDYSTKTFTHSVSYRRYGTEGDYLYVSNDGKSSGLGTKEQPLDIYTAVKYVQAGQTIVLKSGVYNLTKTVKTERGINGGLKEDGTPNYIYMIAEDMADPSALRSNVVFDFGGRCAGMVLAGDYWYFKGFDVANSSDGDKGIQVSGNYNVLDQIRAYKNGNTGIQISRYQVTDLTQADWPSYNKILNCTSYLNADSGYEDADGFSAKLTVGPGNVFDGCISFYNADDGWDLFAKAETGLIGMVTIQNSVAYKNGYVLRADGGSGPLSLYDEGQNVVEVNAGNGNGFKMGGESLSGKHTLKNSIAFENKAKGIDCNSCPDIQVYNCVSFNNQSYNIAFYTNNAAQTGFIADGVISYRTKYLDVADQIKLKNQDDTLVKNATYFQWLVSSAQSRNFVKPYYYVENDWFHSIELSDHIMDTITRNADGTINTHGFLQLKDEYVTLMNSLTGKDGGFGVGGEASDDTLDNIEDDKFTGGEVDKGDEGDDEGPEIPDEDLDKMPENYNGLWMVIVDEDEIYYTGAVVKPEVRVYMGSTLLTQGSQYSVSYKNNTHANKTKDAEGNYTVDIKDAKGKAVAAPTITITGKGGYEGFITREFDIKAVDLDDVCVTDVVEVTAGTTDLSKKVPTLTYNGKKLTNKKDFAIELTAKGQDGAYKAFGSWELTLSAVENGNYTGTRTAYIRIYDKQDTNIVLVSKLKIDSIKSQIFAGKTNPLKPAVTVKNGSTPVTAGDDTFKVEYYDNKAIGTATVAIIGTATPGADGKMYVGTKTATFKIIGGKLTENDFDVVISDKTYGTIPTGKGATPLTVDYKGQAIKFGTVKVSMKQDTAANASNVALTLTQNKDYTVSYKNNAKAGTASITIKGINNYSGSITKNFKINPYNIVNAGDLRINGRTQSEAASDSGLTVTYAQGGTLLPAGILTINGKVVDARDYTISYANNKAAAKIGEVADNKAPVATITGKNGLTGKIKVKFSIAKKDINLSTSGITVEADDIVWKENANAKYYQSKIVVRDSNGKVISASDYTVEYYLGSVDEANKLSAKYSELNVPLKDVDELLGKNGLTIIAKISAKPDSGSKQYNYTGDTYKEYRVVRASVKNAKITVTGMKYYGVDTVLLTKDVTVSVSFKAKDANGRTVTESKVLEGGYGNDFIIENITGNGKVGTAKATVRGIGQYGGTKVVSYKINKQSWNISKAVVGNIEEVTANRLEDAKLTYDDLENKVMLNGKYLTFYEADKGGNRSTPTNDFEIAQVLNNAFEWVDSYVYPSKGKAVYEKDEDGKDMKDENGRKILKETRYTVTVTLKGINSYGGTKKITFTAVVPASESAPESTPEPVPAV